MKNVYTANVATCNSFTSALTLSDPHYLLRPGRGVEYCDQFVCQSVCLYVRKHISGIAGPIFTNVFVQIPCGRGSVRLWQHCDMLCTSGFIDDVTFGRSEPCGRCCDTGAESDFYECIVLIVAKMSLPKHLAPYWSNPSF